MLICITVQACYFFSFLEKPSIRDLTCPRDHQNQCLSGTGRRRVSGLASRFMPARSWKDTSFSWDANRIMPTNSISPHTTNDQANGTPHGFVGAVPSRLPSPNQDDVVLALQNRIRGVETAQRVGYGKNISSGCEAINRLLPGQGYSPGTLVQWLVPDGFRSSGTSPANSTPSGYAADYLSLLSAIEACKNGQSLVVLDPWHQFYPPAVAALGVDMANLIILRSQSTPATPNQSTAHSALQTDKDLYWAIDQSLRCSAVGAVWGPLGSIDQRWFRRFQLSAESSGCLGLFIQSAKEAKQPSWAEVQWLVARPNADRSSHEVARDNQSQSNKDRQQRVQLQLLRCRGSQAGLSVELGVDAVTGRVA